MRAARWVMRGVYGVAGVVIVWAVLLTVLGRLTPQEALGFAGAWCGLLTVPLAVSVLILQRTRSTPGSSQE